MPTQAVNTNFATAGIIFAHCINAPTTAVDSVPSHDMKLQTTRRLLSRHLPTWHHKAVEQNTNNGSYLASMHRMTHFLLVTTVALWCTLINSLQQASSSHSASMCPQKLWTQTSLPQASSSHIASMRPRQLLTVCHPMTWSSKEATYQKLWFSARLTPRQWPLSTFFCALLKCSNLLRDRCWWSTFENIPWRWT